MHTILLNGTWSVRPAAFTCAGEAGLAEVLGSAEDWLPAEVPGEVHLDLMRAGQMDDPSVSTHMPDCRWPETKSWWYRTTFDIGDGFLAYERQALVFDGLDLNADVFVNGRLAGEAADAFVPARFDVRGLVRPGANELVVRLTAGSELARDETSPGQGHAFRPNSAAEGAIPNPMGRAYFPSVAPELQDDAAGAIPDTLESSASLTGHRIWPGRKWLRKPQFTYGWDWVDALPNIGIWRDVHLEGRSHAILFDLRLDTVLDGDAVWLELEAVIENLHPWGERACALVLAIQPPDAAAAIERRYELSAPPGRMPLRDVIEIPEPQLWWPNGMGDQPLYGVTARVVDAGGVVCDERRFATGLRTVEIDRSPLAEGSRFCVRVNGQDVFCRGGNIGPHDAILARISDAKVEAIVAEARDAHMTMIRINGCSIYESPVFYDACDRAGILVWQDLPLTCTTYPDDVREFCEAVRDETEAAVRLLRHHPSIALWCGNNECTWGFRDWWNPDKGQPLELGGQTLYNQVLPEACRRLDPRRPYWPSSPCGGDDPNSELEGDCHWWHPFFMNPDIDRRIRHEVFDECRSRFVSEYGVIGPCHLDSIDEYLLPGERQPGTLAWQLHTNTFEKETVPAAIRRHYAEPEGLSVPGYVRYGQMFQAVIHGYAMEALRFRRYDAADDCQGALIWSYSDCWGETGWSILDYYLRRKASYYWFRRACRPVKVIVRQRGDRLVTRIVNDTLAPFAGEVTLGWRRLDGSGQEVEGRTVDVPANSMLEVAIAPLPPAEERDERHWLYAAVLRADGGEALDQSIWTGLPCRELALAEPVIEVSMLGDGWLEVRSPVFCHAVHVEDHGRARLSDNWFDLLPGVPKRVQVAAGADAPEQADFSAVVGEPCVGE
jgi:beta-mannosidase